MKTLKNLIAGLQQLIIKKECGEKSFAANENLSSETYSLNLKVCANNSRRGERLKLAFACKRN